MISQEDLRNAKKVGVWTLKKDTQFRLKRNYETDDLKMPCVVIKEGTVVHVDKVYCRGRAALLCYIDRTGKVWWSWTHASIYEKKGNTLNF
jgi:hypothetical protein